MAESAGDLYLGPRADLSGDFCSLFGAKLTDGRFQSPFLW